MSYSPEEKKYRQGMISNIYDLAVKAKREELTRLFNSKIQALMETYGFKGTYSGQGKDFREWAEGMGSYARRDMVLEEFEQIRGDVYSDTSESGDLHEFQQKLRSMSTLELDNLDKSRKGIIYDANSGFILKDRSKDSWNTQDKDPFRPDKTKDSGYVKAGRFSKQKEHLDPVSYDDDGMTQQRTRTGLFGFGTERKLYERDGKYYTKLSFVKGGNKAEGPDYLFKGGKEKEISYDDYVRLNKKIKRKRLENISNRNQ